MKTLNEIIQNPNFTKLSYTDFNLIILKKGTHNAAFYSSLGRGFAETVSKREISRVSVGQSDVLYLFNYVGTYYKSKFKNNVPQMNFRFSNSGSTLYLDMTKELYSAIVEALIIYPKTN